MTATYKNWTVEIATAADKDELSGVMARYCYQVGYAFNPGLSYRAHIDLAENLRMFGVAQRMKEAQHRERFLK
jgi:hypothetical protein